MTRQEIIQKFINKVLSWDRENIEDLAHRLYDLDFAVTHVWDDSMDRWEQTFEKLRDYLDIETIPTCPVPPDIPNSQLVFAVDTSGYCLISLDFESTHYGHVFSHMIRTLDQLREKK